MPSILIVLIYIPRRIEVHRRVLAHLDGSVDRHGRAPTHRISHHVIGDAGGQLVDDGNLLVARGILVRTYLSLDVVVE